MKISPNRLYAELSPNPNDMISNIEAIFWFYCFIYIATVCSVIWMTFTTTAAGRPLERIQIGNIISFKLRKKDPEVVIGLIPMSGYVRAKDLPDRKGSDWSLGERAVTGYGLVILPLLFATLILGPSGLRTSGVEIITCFFKSGLSPLSEAPETLRTFWTHLRQAPLQALASTAIVHAFSNVLYQTFAISLSINSGPNDEKTFVDKARNCLTGVPMIWIALWFMAAIKSLF
jgi:hypothetical protein